MATMAKSLDQIVLRAAEVDTQVGQIADACGEQSSGIQQINLAMNQLDKVTQANAAGAVESAEAAEQLSGQSNEVEQSVRILESIVKGSDDRTQAKAPAEIKPGNQPKSSPAQSIPTSVRPVVKAIPTAEPKHTISESKPGFAMPGDSDFRDF